MRLLLDTHTFLWFVGGDPKLSNSARSLIEDTSNQRLLSIASIWEIAIKISTGKLNFGQPFESFILSQMNFNLIDLLQIEVVHTAVVTGLPFYHRDPFDRMLIAQAIAERVPIIGADKVFDDYPVTRLW